VELYQENGMSAFSCLGGCVLMETDIGCENCLFNTVSRVKYGFRIHNMRLRKGRPLRHELIFLTETIDKIEGL